MGSEAKAAGTALHIGREKARLQSGKAAVAKDHQGLDLRVSSGQ